jgi:hypothetical protein
MILDIPKVLAGFQRAGHVNQIYINLGRGSSMKTISIITILFLGLHMITRGDEPANLQFGGVKYQLASVEIGKDGSITNEYVPEGQTLDSWTTLVAVRQWTNATDIGDAVKPWLKMIRPLLTKDVKVFRKPDSGKEDNDVVFEALLAAPDRSYIEINLHRFVKEKGSEGVKAYQFAQKILISGGKSDPSLFVKNRTALFNDLAKLQISPVKKKE